MNYVGVFLSLVVFLPGVVHAELVEEVVEYQAAGLTMNGVIVYDDSLSVKRPGVLVVHEWWGLNDYAKTRAKMLAALGYTAFAIDMYGNGKVTEHPKDAGAFAAESLKNLDAAEKRFTAALEMLKKHSTVDPQHTAAIGYCYGGGLVLHMARKGADLDGVVSFHGNINPKDATPLGVIHSKILVCNGAADPMISKEAITRFKAEMAAAGADLVFMNYPNAKHSFTNPAAAARDGKDSPLGYNETADTQSWKDMKDFFAELF